jgi:hypothetical protein
MDKLLGEKLGFLDESSGEVLGSLDASSGGIVIGGTVGENV